MLALVDALEAAGIRFVLTKHENAAGFMAEGAWHATGAPAVLVATLGPGVANAVNVVANAFQDRVPMIFLTGCVDADIAAVYTHQVFDHRALLRPIVKASLRAEPGAVGAVVDRALAIARDGQPGPVHIDVPIAVAESPSTESAEARSLSVQLGAADDDLVARAAEIFKAARRPLAIAGVDAVNDDAGAAVTAFCRSLKVPLITTYKGKGLLDETDPLALGGAGLSPKADGILLPLVAQSDAVLLIGYDPIEMRIGWRDPWGADAAIIEITPVERSHGMHRATLTLTGGVAATLEALTAHGPPAADPWPDGQPAATRSALDTAFAPGDGFGPEHVFATLRTLLPREAVVTADSGAHRILASQMWRARAPRTMLQSSALCTMGCALPLAMGYGLMRPDVPVVVLVGDACLEMVLGELATLRDLRLPILIVVLADASLALIELKQRMSQRANAGVDFGATDFPSVARAMGGHGAWIDDAAALEREARDAQGRDTFTLLACRIPRRAYDGKI